MIVCINSCVAAHLRDVDCEMSKIISMAWANNTLRTRNSQWARYIDYCATYGLIPLPADCTTVCRFLVVLSKTCKYSTIKNYLSAINILHSFYGHEINFRDFFLTKLVMSGLKQRLGNAVEQKHPLTVHQLIEIRRRLPITANNLDMWMIVVFGFRTLLRKCNIVPDKNSGDEHVIRRSDIRFESNRMIVNVRSSKTNRYKNRIFQIPLSRLENDWFCSYKMMRDHFIRFPVNSDGNLFWKRENGQVKPILYPELLRFVKEMVTWIGLKGSDVGLHSLRRSGAGFLYSIGVPLHDIQCSGDWSSMAVLLYLCTPFDRKNELEISVGQILNSLT